MYMNFYSHLRHVYKKLYYNKNRRFYICSYGGCGSTILTNYLSLFGNVYHIHSRLPPTKLCYVGDENTDNPTYREWFNDIEIPTYELHNYTVIFIYKNPINAIYSRFVNTKGKNNHLTHVQVNPHIKLTEVIHFQKDLYKIEEFFDNYTQPSTRNYKIYCVKYEDFWDNLEEFNTVMNIPNHPILYPIKKESNRNYEHVTELTSIYESLIHKMKKMKFIEIV